MNNLQRLLAARDRIKRALCQAQNLRAVKLDWVEFEREAVRIEATAIAIEACLNPPTEAKLLKCEQAAAGHVDYTDKFSLYAAEAALGLR